MVESVIDPPEGGVDAIKGAGDELVACSLHPRYVTRAELCVRVRHQAGEHDGIG